MLVLEVHNNSSCPANLDSVVPSGGTLWNEWMADPPAGPSSGDCPDFPCATPIPANGTYYFTFTATGRECGQVTWSGSLSGSWGSGCGGAAYSRPYASARVKVTTLFSSELWSHRTPSLRSAGCCLRSWMRS